MTLAWNLLFYIEDYMAIKWGNTTVTAVKWGNTTCTAVYWGSTKVFPDEVTVFNSANANTIFAAVKCGDLGVVGNATYLASSYLVNPGFNPPSTSDVWYDNSRQSLILSRNNPYKTFARSSSQIVTAQYTALASTGGVAITTVLNGKRGLNDGGYSYTNGCVMLFTASAYNLTGKTKIKVSYTGNPDGCIYVGGLTSLPSDYTSNFKLTWCAHSYSASSGGANTNTYTIPAAYTNNQYLMIGVSSTPYEDCNYNCSGGCTITNVLLY